MFNILELPNYVHYYVNCAIDMRHYISYMSHISMIVFDEMIKYMRYMY